MATWKNPIILDDEAPRVGDASPVDAPTIFDAPSAAPDERPVPQKMSGASRFLLWSAGGLVSALLINAVWAFRMLKRLMAQSAALPRAPAAI